MNKTWLGIALVMIMILLINTMIPVGVIAEPERMDDWAYTTVDGEVTLNYYLNGQGELTLFYADERPLYIPAEINGKPVTALSDYLLDFIVGPARFEVEAGSTAFKSEGGALLSADGATLVALNRTAQGKYTVPDGVTAIGGNAFRGCALLEEVVIPDTVQSIGAWAFERCESLRRVELPDGLTWLGYGAFAGCERLSEVRLPSGLTEICERTFYGCMELERIEIPGNVKLISREAFLDCGNLSEILFNEGLATIDERAFDSCDALKSLALPSGLKSIGEFAFYHCANLSVIEVPASVSDIGDWAFKDCAPNLRIRGASGSMAAAAANQYEIRFEVVS